MNFDIHLTFGFWNLDLQFPPYSVKNQTLAQDFINKGLKEGNDLKDPFCNAHDDENTYEGAGHQENSSFNPPFFKKETNDAR